MLIMHKVSEFKPRAGRIFDAARNQPQYVLRKGTLLVIQPAGTPPKRQRQLSATELKQLNRELEALGRHGAKVIEDLRQASAR